MNEEQAVAEAKAAEKPELPVKPQRTLTPLDHEWRMAVALSRSGLIPEHFKNKPENVFIAANTANHMNLPVLEVMNNLYVVQGRAGWMSAYAIGLANKHGPFIGPIEYEQTGKGDDLTVVAIGTDQNGVAHRSIPVSMHMAHAEGWTKTRKGPNPKYVNMPEQMLRYRAAMFLIRTVCPEVLFGMSHTVEELEGIEPRDTDFAVIFDPSAEQALQEAIDSDTGVTKHE